MQKPIEGFGDEIGICPDCGGEMDFDDPLYFCDHCCIIYEWGGSYYDCIGAIENCW